MNCCMCNGVCGHSGPHSYCGQHDPNVLRDLRYPIYPINFPAKNWEGEPLKNKEQQILEQFVARAVGKIETLKFRPDNSNMDESLRSEYNKALKATITLLKSLI